MTDTIPTPEEQPRARRETCGTTNSKKLVYMAVAGLIAALAAAIPALVQSCQALAQGYAARADAEAAGHKGDATYEVWLERDQQREADLAGVVKTVNELLADHKRLRADCAPRRRRVEPVPNPVVLAPKPPPPPTAEAAAAANPPEEKKE